MRISHSFMSKMTTESDDELIEASQTFEHCNAVLSPEKTKTLSLPQFSDISEDEGNDKEERNDNEANERQVQNNRFNYLSSCSDIESRARSAVPKNTLRRNKWAMNTFSHWAIWRNNTRNNDLKILTTVEQMSDEQLSFWLSRFVLEVRKNDGDVYPPQSLFSLIMGIQSHIRLLDKRNLDILRNPTYEDFRQVLDGEMKRLTSLGLGHAQQAEPIEVGEENQLWKNRVLGEHNPKVLVHTLVYLNGLHFSLRSGAEHRNLRYKQSQIKLFKPSSGPAYLRYTEDVSKTFQGGLKHRKLTPKVVEHHENPCKERCHIRLYEKYLFLCPTDGHDEAFYLNPLQHPTEKCWYSRQAMGHNTLQKVVPDLCRKAGISGYKTNHSLRRTTATRLFEKGVPEQLIMERTGHRSVEGVRAYKVTSDAQRLEVSSLINRPGQDGEDADVTDQKPTDTLPATRDTSPVEELFKSVISAENCVINVTVIKKE